MRAASAGTSPTDALNPTVVTALAERGISLAGVAPKPITSELLADADLVITMSRHPTGPWLPDIATHQQHWQLDFLGDDLEAMRTFCDQVDGRVQALLADLSPVRSGPRYEQPSGIVASHACATGIFGFSGSVTA